jgi:hypothetical protein
MQQLAHIQQVLWAVNVGIGIILLTLLIARENYRVYPVFTGYNLVNLAQAVSFYIASRRWGYTSRNMWLFGWSSQGVVTVARALAVTELCRHMLARYRGVWALVWRVLCASALLVMVYSSFAARRKWELALPAVDRSLELSIAVVIVMLLLFARYYDVLAMASDRSLALGFCLYSCFSVVNNTFLDRFLYRYAGLWNLLGILSFLASLLVWTWALRNPLKEALPEEPLVASGVYESVTPEINARLRALNEKLSRFWKPREPRR